MASLFTYIKQCQRFIHDSKQEMIDPFDLIEYANRARREVAMRSQSIRRLTPISGQIVAAPVIAGGSGYTNPTVVITPPDFPSGQGRYPNGVQATGTATQIGGQIINVAINFGGDGYFQPLITISDPTGTGADIGATLSPINVTTPAQEVYNFSDIDLSMWPGVGSVLAVKSVSIIYSNYRYSLPMYAFSQYQALIRNYPLQYQWVPAFSSQYGQGTSGSLYLYPISSQVYQCELDCFCLPSDMTTDQDYEPIPDPWTDAVPMFMAALAYQEMQNQNMARTYYAQFDEFMHRYRAAASPGRGINPYGRY